MLAIFLASTLFFSTITADDWDPLNKSIEELKERLPDTSNPQNDQQRALGGWLQVMQCVLDNTNDPAINEDMEKKLTIAFKAFNDKPGADSSIVREDLNALDKAIYQGSLNGIRLNQPSENMTQALQALLRYMTDRGLPGMDKILKDLAIIAKNCLPGSGLVVESCLDFAREKYADGGLAEATFAIQTAIRMIN
jgi:hypothetical protein